MKEGDLHLEIKIPAQWGLKGSMFWSVFQLIWGDTSPCLLCCYFI